MTFYLVFWVIKYRNNNRVQRNAVFNIRRTLDIDINKFWMQHKSNIQKPYHQTKDKRTFSLGCGATGGLARGKAILGAWGVGIRWLSFIGVSSSSEIGCFGASVTHMFSGSQTAEGNKMLQCDIIQIRLRTKSGQYSHLS